MQLKPYLETKMKEKKKLKSDAALAKLIDAHTDYFIKWPRVKDNNQIIDALKNYIDITIDIPERYYLQGD